VSGRARELNATIDCVGSRAKIKLAVSYPIAWKGDFKCEYRITIRRKTYDGYSVGVETMSAMVSALAMGFNQLLTIATVNGVKVEMDSIYCSMSDIKIA